MKRESLTREATQSRLVAMRIEHLDAVLQIENVAYPVPWSRGNFIDSLAGAGIAHCLVDERFALLGYSVAMLGADELHLLNLTVVPSAEHRGHARHMLDHLVSVAIAGGAQQIWLEVRASNDRARHLYRRYGFDEVGSRKGYYPAPPGAEPSRREDAITMTLVLDRSNR